MPDFLDHIDKHWTLFLDRDGVINKRPPGDYVKNWNDFEFLPGVLDALRILRPSFYKIIVVTNQQGIGKNIMNVEDLKKIHDQLLKEVTKNGGHIDAIYFCPDLETKPNNCRKPSVTMARQALHDFPGINLSKSIMAGDMLTDLQFGRLNGMKSVYIDTNGVKLPASAYDAYFKSLIEFALTISAND